MSVRLKKDGTLIKETQEGLNDVTDVSFIHLNDEVIFDDDVTLRSLFTLISKNIDFYQLIFQNYIAEYTQIILNSNQSDDANEIEYFVVHSTMFFHKDYVDLLPWPDFDAVSFAEENDDKYQKGDKIIRAIDFLPIENFSEVPLKLDNKVRVWHEENLETKEYETNLYTLYQVIQAIIWEISFYGNPEKTKQAFDNLIETSKRIESGEEQLIPLEDVLDSNKILPNFTMKDMMQDYNLPD